uniref:Uncharacterized protein n=1 Tax=Populus trichocarpa TaxID=3694 RepID=A0A3N7HAC1_POPTR
MVFGSTEQQGHCNLYMTVDEITRNVALLPAILRGLALGCLLLFFNSRSCHGLLRFLRF